MDDGSKTEDHASTTTAAARTVAAVNVVHPNIATRAVTDPGIVDQGRVFAEALVQTRPIASSAAEAMRIADMVREGTAHPKGLTQSAAEKMATSGRSLDSLIRGANAKGKAAEVVATSDYRALHEGYDPGIANSPERVAQNLREIRLAPDGSSRKDLLFAFDTKNGDAIWKYNGQVKTGGSRYVTDKLVEMAQKPGYGKVGYVDARYVNADGTPRVASDAFTIGQARRLQNARVRLRGIPNLENRAERLMENIKVAKADGLDPVARSELQQFRDDIVAANRARGVIGRVGGGAAIAAASAAVVSLVIQLATEGKVDAKTLGRSAGTGALFGAGGAAADAALYQVGTKLLEMTPEVAKAFAKQGVAAGFCVLAVGTDLASEIRAARSGEVTVAGAVGGSAAKVALDLLPLVTAPLGLVGLPVLVGAHIGGRWLIGKAREMDRVLDRASAALDREGSAEVTLAEEFLMRMCAFDFATAAAAEDCAATTEVFNEAMGDDLPVKEVALRLVKR